MDIIHTSMHAYVTKPEYKTGIGTGTGVGVLFRMNLKWIL